jgi:hypothetical protein
MFAGGSPLPQEWQEKTSLCSSVTMSDSCSISSDLSLCSILSAKINKTSLLFNSRAQQEARVILGGSYLGESKLFPHHLNKPKTKVFFNSKKEVRTKIILALSTEKLYNSISFLNFGLALKRMNRNSVSIIHRGSQSRIKEEGLWM